MIYLYFISTFFIGVFVGLFIGIRHYENYIDLLRYEQQGVTAHEMLKPKRGRPRKHGKKKDR